MGEIRILSMLELRSRYGFNKFLHTKDPKHRNRSLLLGGVWALLVLMVVGYTGGMVWALCRMGLSDVVEPYLVVAASMLVFLFGILQAGQRIFGPRGYDILTAMPLRPGSVVLSRFLVMYLEDLLLTLLIAIPGGVVHGIFGTPAGSFWLRVPLIPALPLVASILAGTVIMALSARMKHRSLVQTGLMLSLVVGLLCMGFGMEETEITPELLELLVERLTQWYPPAMWELLPFWAVSAAAVGTAAGVVVKCYHPLMGKLMTFSGKHRYVLGALESRSVAKALYLREAKRYFSSSIYVTNTILGPILGTVMAAALWIAGPETLPFDITPVLPYALGAVFTTMTTASTSISMEGKQIWVVQSLPIPAKIWLDGKMLLNLSLMTPFYAISEVLLLLAVRPGWLDGLWLILIPAQLMIFAVVIGIAVDLRFHSFDWEKEEQIVKQSVSSMLGGFAGMLVSVGLGGLAYLMPAAAGVAVLLLAPATAFLYTSSQQVQMQNL